MLRPHYVLHPLSFYSVEIRIDGLSTVYEKISKILKADKYIDSITMLHQTPC